MNEKLVNDSYANHRASDTEEGCYNILIMSPKSPNCDLGGDVALSIRIIALLCDAIFHSTAE